MLWFLMVCGVLLIGLLLILFAEWLNDYVDWHDGRD